MELIQTNELNQYANELSSRIYQNLYTPICTRDPILMDDKEMANRLFNQVLEIWINPEVERRIKTGSLPDQPYYLHAAQIISFTDGRENIVRLNDEVKTEIVGIASKTLQPNEKFVIDEGLRQINNLRLTKEDDPNAGHLTMMHFKGHWFINFDFRYNKQKAKERLEAAAEFLEAAKIGREKLLLRPMAENLFAAIELCIVAQMLLQADRDYTKNQHHTGTEHRYTKFIDIGNPKLEYKDTFLQLKNLRKSGRYLQKDFSLSEEDADRFLEIGNDLMKYTERLLQ
ncbi:MAG TPA: hypothetical protein VE378_00885 [Nitrososphaeraceae archaeon]|nr:hypothetical protein [Nitrososphaeraceae archaeon]